jgi:hypothetical protein
MAENLIRPQNLVNSAIAGPIVPVVADSGGTLQGPASGNNYGWAIIENVSPWIATFTGLGGTRTLLPNTGDLFLASGQGAINYQMSVAPGGSTTPPIGSLTYLQADWYLASGTKPAGTFPFALPAAAAATSLGTETLLATVPNGTLTVTVTPPQNTEALVIIAPSSAVTTCQVQGVDTGYLYPVKEILGDFEWWADVSPLAESLTGSFTITFNVLDAGDWYVLADTFPRITATVDIADGDVGNAAPGSAVQIAGRDASQNLVPAHMTANNLLEIATCASNSPTTGQVTVTGSATAIGAARAGRTGLTIYNPIGSSAPVYLGGASVTAGTGDILEPSESVTYSAPTAWYGITGGASILVSYEDE